MSASKPSVIISDSEWSEVKNKKRLRSSPNENSTKKRQALIKDYWLGAPTKNTYKPLEPQDTSDSCSVEAVSKVKTIKSPPIFVSGVENIIPLKNQLDEIAANDYSIKVLSNNEVKIQPLNSEKYLPIVQSLKSKNTQFYTYQSKQDRTYKVVLRNMHPSADIDEIKSEIEKFGHKVIRIVNIRQAITQKPLPLFFVEIETNDNNKKIYDINKLSNLIVSFEPPRKKREIPQCMQCQEYGHTKNYCYKAPVCVKCAENHLTKDCVIKQKIKEVKCANCQGNHPASYKGCIVRKQLQQRLYPSLREKKINHSSVISNENKFNNTVYPNVSYAEVTAVKTSTSKPQTVEIQNIDAHSPNVNNNKLESMITQLMTKIDTMLNLIVSLINKL